MTQNLITQGSYFGTFSSKLNYDYTHIICPLHLHTYQCFLFGEENQQSSFPAERMPPLLPGKALAAVCLPTGPECIVALHRVLSDPGG